MNDPGFGPWLTHAMALLGIVALVLTVLAKVLALRGPPHATKVELTEALRVTKLELDKLEAYIRDGHHKTRDELQKMSISLEHQETLLKGNGLLATIKQIVEDLKKNTAETNQVLGEVQAAKRILQSRGGR